MSVIADAKCSRRPPAVRSKRFTRKVWCGLAERRPTLSGTFSWQARASVCTTNSHAPTSCSSRTLGNLAIHKWPFGSATLALGRAPPSEPPGAISMRSQSSPAAAVLFSSHSSARLAASSSRSWTNGGSATPSVVKEVARIIKPQAQRADTEGIVYTQQIIRFVKPNCFGDLPRPLLAFQSAAHEQPAPAIGAGIGENAKGFMALGWVLSALKEAEPGIKL